MNDLQILLLTIIFGSTVALISYISKIFSKKSVEGNDGGNSVNGGVGLEDAPLDALDDQAEPVCKKSNAQGLSKRKLLAEEKRSKDLKHGSYSHPWLLTNLKGHSNRVLDMDLSDNGKMLVSAAEDRTCLIWQVKDFRQKSHGCIRGNVEFDYATRVKWSPDSRAYIVQKAQQNTLEVYKLNKKADGAGGSVQVAMTFPSKHGDTDVIIGLGMSATGKFIMTCSDKTQLIIWDIKGEVLSSLDTYHMSTYCAKISPCGRFVATSGFTPDVKLWEVKFSRGGQGDFERVNRAFELTGHTSGVFHFDFNADSSRMATISKDGTWKLFDTKIEFEKGQDPTLLNSTRHDVAGGPNVDETSKIALSADGRVVAISAGSSVYFYSAIPPTAPPPTATSADEHANINGSQQIGRLQNVHSQAITAILFDQTGKYFLTSGDKHIRVFHNAPGYRMIIRDLQAKLKVATGAGQKDRLQQQINEAQKTLDELGGVIPASL